MMTFLKPLTALLTFACGMAAFLILSPLPRIQPVPHTEFTVNREGMTHVSICELARDPLIYDGAMIEIKADLAMNSLSSGSLSDTRCNNEWVRMDCGPDHRLCDRIVSGMSDARTEEGKIVLRGRFTAAAVENVAGIAWVGVKRVEIAEIIEFGRPVFGDIRYVDSLGVGL